MSVPGTAASALMRSRRAARLGGRNPSKKKRSVGRPATQSAASAAEGPGAAVTARPVRDRLGDQLIAGIGNERRSGVGNQRQRLPFGDPSQRARARLGGVVLVVGRERRLDPVAREQVFAKRGCPRPESRRRRPGSPEPARSRRRGCRSASPRHRARGSAAPPGPARRRRQSFGSSGRSRRLPGRSLCRGHCARNPTDGPASSNYRRHSQAQVKMPQFPSSSRRIASVARRQPN